MNKPAFFLASCASILALCLASQSPAAWLKWEQERDATEDVACVDSETYPMTTPEGEVIQVDLRAADDFIATDDSPIYSILVSGEYTSYLPSESGWVFRPTSNLPTAFIMRLYANQPLGGGSGMPGDLITEVEVPDANIPISFVKTVWNYDHYAHIFSFNIMLDQPWVVVKGDTYWLSVQAKFDHDPELNDEYCGWAWDSANPETIPGGNLLDGGHYSADGGNFWNYVQYSAPNKYTGMYINLAFDLFSSPLEVSPATMPANRATNVSIKAAPPIGMLYTAFVIARLQNGQIISFVRRSTRTTRKSAATTISVPCGIKKGLIPLVSNYPALTDPIQAELFSSPVALDAGTYVVKAAFFDPTKPITGEDDAYLLGTQTLVVE